MKINLDFTLSWRFSVVEKTIFRLILNGVSNAQHISDLLRIFSEEVIADSIRKLVNQQLIYANINARTLSVSEPVLAIIETFISNTYDLDIHENLINCLLEENLIISEQSLKEAILGQLLPGIKLGFLADSLDLIIYKRGEIN